MNRRVADSPPTWRISWRESSVLAVALLLPALAAIGYVLSTMPLGIVGEWVWNRSSSESPSPVRWVIPVLAAGVFLAAAVLGCRAVGRWAWSTLVLLPVLITLGAVFQFVALDLPNPGYGIERWAPALYWESTSGYFSVAKRERIAAAEKPRAGHVIPEFLTGYPKWVASADTFHLGTHPPGLIVLNLWIMDRFDARNDLARAFVEGAPARWRLGLSTLPTTPGLSNAEQATLASISLLTWMASLLTALPVYAVARLGGSRPAAFLASAVWLASPAAVLFLPLGDSLYPLLAMSAIFLLVASQRCRLPILAILAGGVVWIGMMLSVAFLAVAAIGMSAVVLAAWRSRRWFQPFGIALCFFAGFAIPCEWMHASFGLNLLDVWRVNLAKHSAFYEAMPRTYWKWVLVDLVEFAILVGPAAAILGSLSAFRAIQRGVGTVDLVVLAWLATVLLLDLSGRNLGEVARLWIFLAPIAAVACARGITASPVSVPLSVVGLLLAAQMAVSLVLLARVEPLLPVPLVAPQTEPIPTGRSGPAASGWVRHRPANPANRRIDKPSAGKSLARSGIRAFPGGFASPDSSCSPRRFCVVNQSVNAILPRTYVDSWVSTNGVCRRCVHAEVLAGIVGVANVNDGFLYPWSRGRLRSIRTLADG